MGIGIEGHNSGVAAMGDGRGQACGGDSASGAGFDHARAAVGTDKIMEESKEREDAAVTDTSAAGVRGAVERPGESGESVAADPLAECGEELGKTVWIAAAGEGVREAREEALPLRIFAAAGPAEVEDADGLTAPLGLHADRRARDIYVLSVELDIE